MTWRISKPTRSEARLHAFDVVSPAGVRAICNVPSVTVEATKAVETAYEKTLMRCTRCSDLLRRRAQLGAVVWMD